MPVIMTEMATDDRIRCRRTKLGNDGEAEGSNGFFSWADGDPLGSTWVWSVLDISRMKPGLGRIVDCRVYWSSVERKDTCSFVGLRTGETGRDGGGDSEPKVVYIPLQTMWPARSLGHQVICLRSLDSRRS